MGQYTEVVRSRYNHTTQIPNMRVFLFSVFLAVASSTPIPDPPPAPYNAPSYAFKYTVEDGPYGPVFSHGEERENYNTKGEYQVTLPDGRVKTVTYTVEGPSGFIADVKYDGVSVYPDAPPPPAYAPAPVYAPAPAAPKAAEPAADDTEEPTNAVDLREGKSAPAPAEPAPAPVYKPAPAPTYKPAPSPYEARQILTPDSSVKKYSFKIIEPEIPEEARQSKAIEAQPNSINEIIPEEDYDEEIATEGALIQEIATEEIISPAEEEIIPIFTTEIPIEEEEEIIVISPVEEVVLVEEPEEIIEEVELIEEPEEEIIEEEEEVVLIEEPEEEIIEEVTEEAESVFEEIVLPTVEAAVPIIEAAPIQEAADLIVEEEASPIIDPAPIVEAAPIQEAAPVAVEAAEGFFQVQVPVQESAPVEEAFRNEFVPAPAAPEAALTPALAPVPEEPIFTPSLPPAPAQEPFIPIQEPIIVEDAPDIVPAPVEEEFSSFPVVDNTPAAVDEIAQEAVIEAAQNTLPRRVRQRRPTFRPLQPRPNGVSGFFRNLRGRTSKLMQAVRGIFRN